MSLMAGLGLAIHVDHQSHTSLQDELLMRICVVASAREVVTLSLGRQLLLMFDSFGKEKTPEHGRFMVFYGAYSP